MGDTVAKPNLLDLCGIDSGIFCAVGAGGKKSTLYRLAALHPGRVALTASVMTHPVPEGLGARVVVAPQPRLLAAVKESVRSHRLVAYAQPSSKRQRLGGVDAARIVEIHRKAGIDLTLIKADGARMRWIKAPGPDEPQIPAEADGVIVVVSARALGEPLSERIAHRVERIEAVTGRKRGEPVTPESLARLLTDPAGLLKGVGRSRVIPIINMVDTPERESLAIRTAQQALRLTSRFAQVILTCMQRAQPVVGVVTRESLERPLGRGRVDC